MDSKSDLKAPHFFQFSVSFYHQLGCMFFLLCFLFSGEYSEIIYDVCCLDYSTKSMRKDGGYGIIKKAIEKLGLRHKEHIAAYGEGNERRLTGRHETADINTFLWVSLHIIWYKYLQSSNVGHWECPYSFRHFCLQGVANRGASIRVGRDTEKAGKGEGHSITLIPSVTFSLLLNLNSLINEKYVYYAELHNLFSSRGTPYIQWTHCSWEVSLKNERYSSPAPSPMVAGVLEKKEEEQGLYMLKF